MVKPSRITDSASLSRMRDSTCAVSASTKSRKPQREGPAGEGAVFGEGGGLVTPGARRGLRAGRAAMKTAAQASKELSQAARTGQTEGEKGSKSLAREVRPSHTEH